MTMDTIIIC